MKKRRTQKPFYAIWLVVNKETFPDKEKNKNYNRNNNNSDEENLDQQDWNKAGQCDSQQFSDLEWREEEEEDDISEHEESLSVGNLEYIVDYYNERNQSRNNETNDPDKEEEYVDNENINVVVCKKKSSKKSARSGNNSSEEEEHCTVQTVEYEEDGSKTANRPLSGDFKFRYGKKPRDSNQSSREGSSDYNNKRELKDDSVLNIKTSEDLRVRLRAFRKNKKRSEEFEKDDQSDLVLPLLNVSTQSHNELIYHPVSLPLLPQLNKNLRKRKKVKSETSPEQVHLEVKGEKLAQLQSVAKETASEMDKLLNLMKAQGTSKQEDLHDVIACKNMLQFHINRVPVTFKTTSNVNDKTSLHKPPCVQSTPLFHCPTCLDHWNKHQTIVQQCPKLPQPVQGPVINLTFRVAEFVKRFWTSRSALERQQKRPIRTRDPKYPKNPEKLLNPAKRKLKDKILDSSDPVTQSCFEYERDPLPYSFAKNPYKEYKPKRKKLPKRKVWNYPWESHPEGYDWYIPLKSKVPRDDTMFDDLLFTEDYVSSDEDDSDYDDSDSQSEDRDPAAGDFDSFDSIYSERPRVELEGRVRSKSEGSNQRLTVDGEVAGGERGPKKHDQGASILPDVKSRPPKTTRKPLQRGNTEFDRILRNGKERLDHFVQSVPFEYEHHHYKRSECSCPATNAFETEGVQDGEKSELPSAGHRHSRCKKGKTDSSDELKTLLVFGDEAFSKLLQSSKTKAKLKVGGKGQGQDESLPSLSTRDLQTGGKDDRHIHDLRHLEGKDGDKPKSLNKQTKKGKSPALKLLQKYKLRPLDSLGQAPGKTCSCGSTNQEGCERCRNHHMKAFEYMKKQEADDGQDAQVSMSEFEQMIGDGQIRRRSTTLQDILGKEIHNEFMENIKIIPRNVLEGYLDNYLKEKEKVEEKGSADGLADSDSLLSITGKESTRHVHPGVLTQRIRQKYKQKQEEKESEDNQTTKKSRHRLKTLTMALNQFLAKKKSSSDEAPAIDWAKEKLRLMAEISDKVEEDERRDSLEAAEKGNRKGKPLRRSSTKKWELKSKAGREDDDAGSLKRHDDGSDLKPEDDLQPSHKDFERKEQDDNNRKEEGDQEKRSNDNTKIKRSGKAGSHEKWLRSEDKKVRPQSPQRKPVSPAPQIHSSGSETDGIITPPTGNTKSLRKEEDNRLYPQGMRGKGPEEKKHRNLATIMKDLDGGEGNQRLVLTEVIDKAVVKDQKKKAADEKLKKAIREKTQRQYDKARVTLRGQIVFMQKDNADIKLALKGAVEELKDEDEDFDLKNEIDVKTISASTAKRVQKIKYVPNFKKKRIAKKASLEDLAPKAAEDKDSFASSVTRPSLDEVKFFDYESSEDSRSKFDLPLDEDENKSLKENDSLGRGSKRSGDDPLLSVHKEEDEGDQDKKPSEEKESVVQPSVKFDSKKKKGKRSIPKAKSFKSQEAAKKDEEEKAALEAAARREEAERKKQEMEDEEKRKQKEEKEQRKQDLKEMKKQIRFLEEEEEERRKRELEEEQEADRRRKEEIERLKREWQEKKRRQAEEEAERAKREAAGKTSVANMLEKKSRKSIDDSNKRKTNSKGSRKSSVSEGSSKSMKSMKSVKSIVTSLKKKKKVLVPTSERSQPQSPRAFSPRLRSQWGKALTLQEAIAKLRPPMKYKKEVEKKTFSGERRRVGGKSNTIHFDEPEPPPEPEVIVSQEKQEEKKEELEQVEEEDLPPGLPVSSVSPKVPSATSQLSLPEAIESTTPHIECPSYHVIDTLEATELKPKAPRHKLMLPLWVISDLWFTRPFTFSCLNQASWYFQNNELLSAKYKKPLKTKESAPSYTSSQLLLKIDQLKNYERMKQNVLRRKQNQQLSHLKEKTNRQDLAMGQFSDKYLYSMV